MNRRPLLLVALMIALALPAVASQFQEQSFDAIARSSNAVVRGEVVSLYSAWDESREVIFTYATVRVKNYFADTTGPDMIIVREVGGTVDDYTQEAIGFPALRQGEEVVLFLSKWEDNGDYRINAFNQGKFLVRGRKNGDVLTADARTQGAGRENGLRQETNAAIEDETPGMTIDEFTGMVEMARMGASRDVLERQ
jgi:hypothetical protein